MGLVTRFEDLEVWKIAREIVNDINRDFSGIKDFGFKDQIYSAGFSIMNNISEGFGRESRKEFHRFLDFSKGSCCEVKNMYYIVSVHKVCFIRHCERSEAILILKTSRLLRKKRSQ